MDEQIKRIVNRAYPELVSGLHLPVFARVEAISDASSQVRQSTRFRPRYAADVRVLKANGEVDELIPLFRAVPLPVNMAGMERGVFGFPEAGAIVEIAFAYGLPDRPFIRAVLAEGLCIPAIKPGEAVLQASRDTYQRADVDGNWHRKTTADITDTSENLLHRIGNIIDSLAGLKQLIKVEDGGTVWLGDESNNVLKILSDLIQVVSDVASTAAEHTHPYTDDGAPMTTEAPTQSAAFTGQGSSAGDLKNTLDPIIESPSDPG